MLKSTLMTTTFLIFSSFTCPSHAQSSSNKSEPHLTSSSDSASITESSASFKSPSHSLPKPQLTRARREDIQRWNTPDITPADKKRTAEKEARNAYAENKNQCSQLEPSKQTICLSEVKAIFDREWQFAQSGRQKPYPASKLDIRVESIDAEQND